MSYRKIFLPLHACFGKLDIEIIKKFIENNNNFEVVEIDSPLKHENIGGGLQFLPDISNGLGFFVCKLKRVK